MIAWPKLDGKPVGTALRTSTWEMPTGIIGDVTRSGKLIVRANHIKAPNTFSITMHMTLKEYRRFMEWWKNECRRGVHTFQYPKINDNTGVMIEYQFDPESRISIHNTSGDNLEVSMSWLEAT